MTDKELLEEIKKLRETILEENNFLTRCVLANVFVGLGFIDYLIKQAERVQELEKKHYNLKELAYKTQIDFLNANKHRNIYKEQNKRYRKAIENIKKYNQKALEVDDYTKNEALLDISLEIMKLEGGE